MASSAPYYTMMPFRTSCSRGLERVLGSILGSVSTALALIFSVAMVCCRWTGHFRPATSATTWISLAACGFDTSRRMRISVGVTGLP